MLNWDAICDALFPQRAILRELRANNDLLWIVYQRTVKLKKQGERLMSTMTEQVQAADAAADDSRKRLHDAVMALISVVKMLAAKVGDPDAKAAADLAMTEFANAKAADDALQAEVAKVVADNQASGGTVEQ